MIDFEVELDRLIQFVINQEAERTGPDKDYYRWAKENVQKQKQILVKEFQKLEDALGDRDPYYFSDRKK